MSIDVPFKDIPQTVLDEVGAALQHYFVPILGLISEKPTDPLNLIGSGTLVKIGSGHYILTAAHVWDAATRFPTVGLSLTTYESWFSIPRDVISASTLQGASFGEFGPDLSLLRIPPALMSRIAAHKSVLDLPWQRQAFLTDPLAMDFGIWAVTGMSEAISAVRARPEQGDIVADAQGRAFFSGVAGTQDREGWDYVELSADMGLADVPPSFHGVSGAGLWQVPLSVSKTGGIVWNGRKRFNGVAYWESDVVDGHRFIRCHGPRSLFERAWAQWELPK